MAFADTTPRNVRGADMPVQIVLAGAVKRGDLVGFSTGWKRAKAAATAILANLVAADDGEIGDTINCFRTCILEGFAGGTAGGALYMADADGKYGASAGATSQIVGRMLTATSAYVGFEVN